MILASTISYGSTVVAVVSIVGFATAKLEGIREKTIMYCVFIAKVILRIIYLEATIFRLNNEQRAAVTDYFHVYKVILLPHKIYSQSFRCAN